MRVFVDSRADPYPAGVWNDYLAIIDLGPAWRRRLTAWGVNAIIARRDGRFARAIGTLEGWRRVRGDARYVLYEQMTSREGVRRAPGAARRDSSKRAA